MGATAPEQLPDKLKFEHFPDRLSRTVREVLIFLEKSEKGWNFSFDYAIMSPIIS